MHSLLFYSRKGPLEHGVWFMLLWLILMNAYPFKSLYVGLQMLANV